MVGDFYFNCNIKVFELSNIVIMAILTSTIVIMAVLTKISCNAKNPDKTKTFLKT